MSAPRLVLDYARAIAKALPLTNAEARALAAKGFVVLPLAPDSRKHVEAIGFLWHEEP